MATNGNVSRIELVTNLAYVVAAVAVLLTDWWGWVFALALLYVAVGSTLWHLFTLGVMKDWRPGADHDIIGMLSVLLVGAGYAIHLPPSVCLVAFPIAYAMRKWLPQGPFVDAPIHTPKADVFSWMSVKLLAAYLFYAVGTWVLHGWRPVVVTTGFFAIAIGPRLSPLRWGHALWHVLSAFAAYMLWWVAWAHHGLH